MAKLLAPVALDPLLIGTVPHQVAALAAAVTIAVGFGAIAGQVASLVTVVALALLAVASQVAGAAAAEAGPSTGVGAVSLNMAWLAAVVASS